MADVDNMHKDISTREPGCHILTLTAATWLGWPSRVLGSSLRMPAVGRPGVGMPYQRFPGVLIRGSLTRFFLRGLMKIKPDERWPHQRILDNESLIGGFTLCRFLRDQQAGIWASPISTVPFSGTPDLGLSRYELNSLRPSRFGPSRLHIFQKPPSPHCRYGAGRFLRGAVKRPST